MYPYEFSDSLETSSPVFYEVHHPLLGDSASASVPTFIAGTLREPRVETTAPPDEVEASAPVFIAGTLKAPLVETDAPPDEAEATPPTFITGELKAILITYTNWPLIAEDEESVTVTAPTFITGTLS